MPTSDTLFTFYPTLSQAWTAFVVQTTARILNVSQSAGSETMDAEAAYVGGYAGWRVSRTLVGIDHTDITWFVGLDSPDGSPADARILALETGFTTQSAQFLGEENEGALDDIQTLWLAWVQDIKQSGLETFTDAADVTVDTRVVVSVEGSFTRFDTVTTWDTMTATITADDRVYWWTTPSVPVDGVGYVGDGVDAANTLAQVANVPMAGLVAAVNEITNQDDTISINQNAAAFSIKSKVVA